MKPPADHEYIRIDQGPWAAFPETLSAGGITRYSGKWHHPRFLCSALSKAR